MYIRLGQTTVLLPVDSYTTTSLVAWRRTAKWKIMYLLPLLWNSSYTGLTQGYALLRVLQWNKQPSRTTIITVPQQIIMSFLWVAYPSSHCMSYLSIIKQLLMLFQIPVLATAGANGVRFDMLDLPPVREFDIQTNPHYNPIIHNLGWRWNFTRATDTKPLSDKA